MFGVPSLEAGLFPASPVQDPAFRPFVEGLGIQLDPAREPLGQIMPQARTNWLDYDPSTADTSLAAPHSTGTEYPLVRAAGLIDQIDPPRAHYAAAMVDGGSQTDVLEPRLAHAYNLARAGLVDNLTIFAGQCKRKSADTDKAMLSLAKAAYPDADDWGKAWLEQELAKDPAAASIWDRPFATEHEVATLQLMDQFGSQLAHDQTVPRRGALTTLPGFPEITKFAERFLVGDDVTIDVMQSPAIIRAFGDRTLPPERARSTGRSCFIDWLNEARPPEDSPILLSTSNPYVYRTWLDLLLGRAMAGRPDVIIDGAGAAISPEATRLDVLKAAGTILISFYNLEHAHADLVR